MTSILRLKGISNHGKNRVKEHGELWKVTAHSSKTHVMRLNEIFIESLETGDLRWVNPWKDRNFEVEVVSNGK